MGQCLSSTAVAQQQEALSPVILGRLEPAKTPTTKVDRKLSTPTTATAICFEGGGFLATAVYTGVLSGLLSAQSQKMGTAATLAATDLLENFDIVSSVSGGTWFASELAYSRSFVAMVESMAANPDEAAQIFQREWIQKWSRNIIDPEAEAFEPIAKAFPHIAGVDVTILMVGHFLKEGLTWENFVQQLLQTTAGIDPSTTLGSETDPWTHGKTWLINTSVVTPSKACKYATQAYAVGNLVEGFNYHYSVQGVDKLFPPYIPARISVTWPSHGAAGREFPIDFVASDALPCGAQLVWESSGHCFFNYSDRRRLELPCVADVSALALSSVTASSSAFLGGTVLSPEYSTLISDLAHGDMATWVATTTDGNPYTTASAIMEGATSANRSSTSKLASNGVCSLVDAVYTDNTGISNAIAAGAREVLFVGCSGMDDASLVSLFSPGSGELAAVSVTAKVPMASFPIFAMSQVEAKAALASLKSMSGVATQGYLKDIYWGAIDVVTVENPYLGIPAGVQVKLQLLLISTSNLTIGLNEVFGLYSDLVGEIVLLLSKSSDELLASHLLHGMR